LEDYQHTNFAWGQDDCIHFVGRAVEYQVGETFDDESLWEYTTEQQAKRNLVKFYKKHNVKNIVDLFDRLYTRTHAIPPDGSIVAKATDGQETLGYALGVVSGRHGAFLDWDGLKFLPLDHTTDFYWTIK